jgi:hypothetical protein
MLARHVSDCESEHAPETEIEALEQDDFEVFSPRTHQAGFWN